MRKLIVVSVHPIHYNDFLFHEINKSGIDITVHYANKILANYPWKQKLDYSFPHRNCNYFLGIDWYLIRQAIFSRNTTFIIAGWDTFFKNVLLLTLILFCRRYVVWTDTVKPNAKRIFLKSAMRAWWLGGVWSNAYRILTTGEVGVRAMLKIYSKGINKIINFPFAADLNYFNTTPDLTTFNNEKIILSSGRLLNSHKGYDVAIRALSIVRDKGYKFKYFIAGTGPDEKALKDLIRERNLEEHIILLGWQELPNVKALYAKAHIFLHPAHFDPFPNAVLEAMASALIVIASDQSGSAVERIENGVSGFIFKDNDVAGLAECIINVFRCKINELEATSKAARATSKKWDVSYNVNIIKGVL